VNSRYDPQDDAPEPTVDRVFPKDQCEVIPYTVYFPASGPHNYMHPPGDGAYADVWWVHAGGGAAVPA
jgi:hypothetical protein